MELLFDKCLSVPQDGKLNQQNLHKPSLDLFLQMVQCFSRQHLGQIKHCYQKPLFLAFKENIIRYSYSPQNLDHEYVALDFQLA
jgi:hypothetical protein